MPTLPGNPASYYWEGLEAALPTPPSNVAPHTVCRAYTTDSKQYWTWNGTIWRVELAPPPANPAGLSASSEGCNIAGYLANSVIKESMQQAINAIQQSQTLLGYGQAIIGAIPGAGLVINFLIKALNGLYTAVTSGPLVDYQNAVADPTLWSEVTCAIYSAISADGQVTQANFPTLQANVAAIVYAHTDVTTAINDWLSATGYSGLAQLQQVGALALYECTGCGSTGSTGPAATPAHFAAGQYADTIHAGGTSASTTVLFTKAFPAAPAIVVSASDPDVIVAVTARAADQFTVVAKVAVPAAADVGFNVYWTANMEGSQ